jgi:hypothetical protein
MIHKSKAIPLRLSLEAFEAYEFLQDKPCSRSDLICKFGEIGLINFARKYKLKSRIKKVILPF